MEALFNKYQTTKPGEKPFFLLENFVALLNDCNLMAGLNPERLGTYFNLSMSIQIDETKSENHIKMRNKLEFFEMYARMVSELKFTMVSDERITYPAVDFNSLCLGEKMWVVLPSLFKTFSNKSETKLVDDAKAQLKVYSDVIIN